MKNVLKSPRGVARWGMFAGESATMELPGEVRAITLLGGNGLPIPPIYRGCTKEEKREFMGKYLNYQRRLQALSERTEQHVVLMPLPTCIEIKTLVRICMLEMKRPAESITESDWTAYFLAAISPLRETFLTAWGISSYPGSG